MSLYNENVAKGLEAGGSFPASPKREVTSALLSLREKVIAYPVDWRPVRKATLTTSERPAYLVRYQGTNHTGT